MEFLFKFQENFISRELSRAFFKALTAANFAYSFNDQIKGFHAAFDRATSLTVKSVILALGTARKTA